MRNRLDAPDRAESFQNAFQTGAGELRQGVVAPEALERSQGCFRGAPFSE